MQALYLAAGALIGAGIIGTARLSPDWAFATGLGALFVVVAAIIDYHTS